jgi:hypothetical protein
VYYKKKKKIIFIYINSQILLLWIFSSLFFVIKLENHWKINKYCKTLIYINIQYPVDPDVQVVLMPLKNLQYILYYEKIYCSFSDDWLRFMIEVLLENIHGQ